MRYLLDTNILLLYLREDKTAMQIEAEYQIWMRIIWRLFL